jgi:hypothetical protein
MRNGAGFNPTVPFQAFRGTVNATKIFAPEGTKKESAFIAPRVNIRLEDINTKPNFKPTQTRAKGTA